MAKPPDDTLAFLLADVSRLMRSSFRARLLGSPLTPVQARALVHVSRNEGIRQIALADIMEVKPITLARLLDQLVRAGTVERRPDETDRRAFRIFLTKAAGRELLAIHRVADAVQADALEGVGKQAAMAMQKTLRTMRANLVSR